MQTIVPYLTVKNAVAAIDFYKKAFGATENGERAPNEDGRILHADLSVNGGSVYLMDEFPEHANGECGSVFAPSPDKPSATSMVIQLAKPADVDAGYKRAVDAGCKSVSAPEDTFWNARFAVVCDPYGHVWMFNAALSAN